MITLNCTICFANENPYLSETFWSENNANYTPLDKSSLTYHLNGSFQYISDEDNGIFALCFNIDETSIPEHGNNILISYYVTSESENFHFSINENGIFQCNGDTDSFDFETNFVLRQTGGVYMAVVEFDNKKISRQIQPFLFVNERRYLITKDEIVLESKPATTKAPKTTSKSTTKSKTTNKNLKTTERVNSTKQTTTKYQPNGAYQPTNYIAPSNTTTYQTTNQLTENQSAIQIIPDNSTNEEKGTISPTAKVMMAGGAFAATMGIATIIYTTLINKNKTR